MTPQEGNKETTIRLLDAAFNRKDPARVGSLVTERYIQHNPVVPTGREGLVGALPNFYMVIPTLKWEMKHIWAEGDYVIVHSIYDFGKPTAVVDIFRFNGDLADEHWDVS
ncbi:MAG: SnoaL-like domain protein [Methanomassiliicoccales archaeon PtaU1.Bin124]|nr:MAG: SnoaL-like domain protein [Methanomassiliicoccales archaeon PtaU1.Bin124]